MDQKQNPKKVNLNDVRLLYGQALFEPQRGPNGEGEPKHSGTFAFKPEHPAHAAIKKAMQAAAEEKWGAKAGEVFLQLKAGDRLCLHDGAAKADKEGYAGHLYVSASNKLKPLVIDGNKSPLSASSGKVYSGCYVNASIELWAQDNKFGKRINATLMGVQFLRDGARLVGGGVASADDFEAIPDAAPEAGAAQASSTGGAATGGNPDPFA
jgi:hypothetical protein